MPILIMGITAFIIFVIIMAVLAAAGLEERHNAAEQTTPRKYHGKPVKHTA